MKFDGLLSPKKADGRSPPDLAERKTAAGQKRPVVTRRMI
jgi:hypothetical protein